MYTEEERKRYSEYLRKHGIAEQVDIVTKEHKHP